MPAQKPPAPARIWAWRDRLRSPACLSVLLALATLAVYWPVTRFDFINFDDHTYVSQNPHVLPGLSWRGVVWAFQVGYSANWHPLTWLSHMLDVQLFGVRPGLHHLVNLLFHGANAILLFLLLHSMTRALWRSAIVAALFALHPLHVESVAWVAERKDVLSTFFGLLAIWAYAAYVKAESKTQSAESRNPQPTSGSQTSSIFYLLSLALFACSLMSKPMLVTLPFLLLLLDYWPLRRMQKEECRKKNAEAGASSLILHPSSFILLEKLPFLALSAASSVVTFLAQKAGHALFSVEAIPMGLRVSNALVSYVRYIGKMVWPGHLALLYPYPGSWPVARVLFAALGLAAASFLALRWMRIRPYFTVGWFWFLGALVPVIGLVQVGSQALADRYTYIPLVGLFVSVVWIVAELSNRWPHRSTIVPCFVILVLLVCATVSRLQVAYWQDSITVFERALAVTTDNPVAHQNLGAALSKQGRLEEAKRHLTAAIQLNPHVPETQYELGHVLLRENRTREAIEQYQLALSLRPNWPEVLNNLAWLLATHPSAEFRNGTEAVRLAERTTQLTQATNLWMVSTLAAAYAEAGRFPEAVSAQERVCGLAAAQGLSAQAESFQRRLDLYRSGHAYHRP
jgi:protein O-mannosyl-transferase